MRTQLYFQRCFSHEAGKRRNVMNAGAIHHMKKPSPYHRKQVSPLFRLGAKVLGREINFLIDSGAQTSTIPMHLIVERRADITPTDIHLRAANGTSIPVHGEISLALDLPNFSRPFCWTFL